MGGMNVIGRPCLYIPRRFDSLLDSLLGTFISKSGGGARRPIRRSSVQSFSGSVAQWFSRAFAHSFNLIKARLRRQTRDCYPHMRLAEMKRMCVKVLMHVDVNEWTPPCPINRRIQRVGFHHRRRRGQQTVAVEFAAPGSHRGA